MGRTDEKLIEDLGGHEPVSSPRFTYIHYNEKRDLPMLLAVRNATFISHGQLHEQLVATGTEASRRAFNWRVQRLVRAGLVEKLPPHTPILWGGLPDYSQWIGLP